MLNIISYSHCLLIAAANSGADKHVFMQLQLWLVEHLVSTDSRVNNEFTAATGFNTRMFPKLNMATMLWLGVHSLSMGGGLNIFQRESDRWVSGGWQMRKNDKGQNAWFLISSLHSIPTSIAANNTPPLLPISHHHCDKLIHCLCCSQSQSLCGHSLLTTHLLTYISMTQAAWPQLTLSSQPLCAIRHKVCPLLTMKEV